MSFVVIKDFFKRPAINCFSVSLNNSLYHNYLHKFQYKNVVEHTLMQKSRTHKHKFFAELKIQIINDCIKILETVAIIYQKQEL